MANDTPNGTRPGTPHNNGTVTPNPAVATIHNLRVGCKAYAHKDDELRQAEILSITIKQGEPHFYVHYKEYNKVPTSLFEDIYLTLLASRRMDSSFQP
jgi:hypothetical protein